MRTEMTRELAGVRLHAAVTVGALCDLHARHGDMMSVARKIDNRDTRAIRDGLILLVAAAGSGLSDAEGPVDRAIEEAGIVPCAGFLQELLQHALTKATDAAGKPEPDR